MDQFKASGRGERCLFAETRPAHRCSGPLERHHLIQKSFLRREFPGQFDVIWAPAIAVNLCQSGHQQVTVAHTRVRWLELPVKVIAWSEELGIAWRLELECPKAEEDRSPFLSRVDHEPDPCYEGKAQMEGSTATVDETEKKMDEEFPPESEGQFDGPTAGSEFDEDPRTESETDEVDGPIGAFGIEGSGQFTLEVGGELPDVSVATLKGKSIETLGDLAKGDSFSLVVDVRVGQVKFIDKVDGDGEISETKRVHVLEVESVRRQD